MTTAREASPTLLWAPQAWLPSGWQAQVLLSVGSDGCWSEIRTGVLEPPADAQVLASPLLPGLVNAHSHAFQRALVGLAERRNADADDFWSWRRGMYRVAQRIDAAQLRAIAAKLYVELLQGGYTQVCEFHYLCRDTDGQRYDDPLAMGWALADAAATAGIGLTLLPTLYERGGFVESGLRVEQQRFACAAPEVWAAAQAIAVARRPLLDAGLAIHSLRAVGAASITELNRLAHQFAGPIHIHVAEQTAEVDECLAATGRRPIEWLAAQGLLDSRWQLVHATHALRSEIDAVAASGAGLVACPTTEANLGDGLLDLPGWLDAGIALTIGSDSQVNRDWREELRWLEYGQRLALRRRNVAAAPQHGQPATAERLFGHIARSSAAAAGQAQWGLVPGARADALVADAQDPALAGMPAQRWLDALVFSSPALAWRDVMVAGRWVIRERLHPRGAAIADAYAQAVTQLAPDE